MAPAPTELGSGHGRQRRRGPGAALRRAAHGDHPGPHPAGHPDVAGPAGRRARREPHAAARGDPPAAARGAHRGRAQPHGHRDRPVGRRPRGDLRHADPQRDVRGVRHRRRDDRRRRRRARAGAGADGRLGRRGHGDLGRRAPRVPSRSHGRRRRAPAPLHRRAVGPLRALPPALPAPAEHLGDRRLRARRDPRRVPGAGPRPRGVAARAPPGASRHHAHPPHRARPRARARPARGPQRRPRRGARRGLPLARPR